MLYEILQEIRNFFVCGTHSGEYTVENGSISLPFLLENQYFRIVGSVLNDGVYKYTADLKLPYDETFKGEIWRLAVPQSLLKKVADIERYCADESNKKSAYTSESWSGYSYTKKTDKNGASVSWKTEFATDLNQWRKI